MEYRSSLKMAHRGIAVLCLFGLLLIGINPAIAQQGDVASSRPNFILIVVDDLNDWVGPLKGHPLAKTPSMDRIAEQGMTFTNAHVQAPVCNPSRAALLTGLRPTTTGVYGLGPWFRDNPRYASHLTFVQLLMRAGYRTEIYGKVFDDGNIAEVDESEVELLGDPRNFGPLPEKKLVDGLAEPLLDWGVFPANDELQNDDLTIVEAIDAIDRNDDRPFLISVGIRRPHVPLYASQHWFDLYPDDDSVLPPVLETDRDDVPRFAWYLNWKLPEPRLKWVREQGQWRNKVRAYLASVSYADWLVGKLLDALEASGKAKNTHVILVSDHGYHLGEKDITGKNTLWERSTRVPLLWLGPGVTSSAKIASPVEVIDIYPTLAALADERPPDEIDGRSLTPFFDNPSVRRAFPAITSHGPGNHAVRDENYRYIRYADGSEEFYDLKQDPHEWWNLANLPSLRAKQASLAKYIPAVNAPPVKGAKARLIEYVDAIPIWEGIVIEEDVEIPGL